MLSFLESTQDLLSQMRQVRWGGKFNDTQVSSYATKVQEESSFLLLFDNVAGLDMALIKVLFANLTSSFSLVVKIARYIFTIEFVMKMYG